MGGAVVLGAERDQAVRCGPQERPLLVVAGGAHSDDLSAVVHVRDLSCLTSEGAEIDEPACRRPGEPVRVARWGVAVADDLTVVVDRERGTGGSAERAEVHESSPWSPREPTPESACGRELADDLAAVVHRIGRRVGAHPCQRANVHEPIGCRPGEGVALPARGHALADDLTAIADRVGVARRTAGERAEVGHPVILRPEEGVRRTVLIFAVADDLAVVVDAGRVAGFAAERAEVDHPARLGPREPDVHRGFLAGKGPGVRRRACGVADDLAVVVHLSCHAGGPPEGAQGHHPASLGPGERPEVIAAGGIGSGAVADNLTVVVDVVGLPEGAAQGSETRLGHRRCHSPLHRHGDR